MATAIQPMGNDQKVLHPSISYSPTINFMGNSHRSLVWRIAALVTAAAFIALAAVAIAYTTVQFPIHLPVVSILVFAAGMPSSFQAFKYMWEKHESYAKEAKIDQKLIQYMDKMKDKVPMDPEIDQIQLLPAFARYQYFMDEKKEILSLHNEVVKDAKDVNMSNVDVKNKEQVESFKTSCDRKFKSQEYLTKAALSQLKAAEQLYIIKNPYEHPNYTDFFTLFTFSSFERYVAKANGDQTADVLVKTPKKTYTASQILETAPDKLMREIFEGKVGYRFWS